MKTFITTVVVLAIAYLLYLGFSSLSDISNVAPEPQQTQEVTVSYSKAEQAALDEGYTEVSSTGMAFLGCSKDDSVLTSEHITAKNSNGKNVELTVCCGLIFKGCTVRH